MLNTRFWSKAGFWIVLFFVVRLYGITLPPLEVAHNWRQTTVTMVARNFMETDAHIFYPRIDFAGDKSGITGMEFPLLNYLIYLVSLVFGYDHWYGRLINLVVSSLGTWYFYLLVKKYFHRRVAFPATLILLSSLWFAYSRKIMPDTFSISLILMGIYAGSNYLDRNASWRTLAGSFILLMLGTLSKLPSTCLIGVFLPLLMSRQTELKRRIVVVVIISLAMFPSVIWYFIWVPHLVETYGFWHFFMGKSMAQGLSEIIQLWEPSLKNFYEHSLKFMGFGVFLTGLFFAFRRKEWKIVWVFMVVFIPFLIILLKAGQTFAHHSYYMLPFLPVMALVAGYALSLIGKQWITTLLLAGIVMEGLLNQMHDFRVKDKEMPVVALESVLDRVSTSSDLILINSGDYPTPMYFAHRKGWISSNEHISGEGYREELISKGLKYIVILKRTFGSDISLPEEIVFTDENYTIYRVGTH